MFAPIRTGTVAVVGICSSAFGWSGAFSITGGQYRGLKTRAYWKSSISRNPDGEAALEELLADADVPNEQGLAFLFFGQHHAENFEHLVRISREKLGAGTTTLALVGGGVVGGGYEVDDGRFTPVMSMLSGKLPDTSQANGFFFNSEKTPYPPSSPSWSMIRSNGRIALGERHPSFVVFGDPWSPIDSVLKGLDEHSRDGKGAVITGGISCPSLDGGQSTIALNGISLPQGSVAGVSLTGTLGLQAVVAQGSRAVGPKFTVTGATDSILTELSCKPALQQLQKVVEAASVEEKELVNTGGLLCGIEVSDAEPSDYLVRQIVGLIPQGGGIVVRAARLREGDSFRFHVRDAGAARADLDHMVQRAKTERLFVGPELAGIPVAALQVSCVARGRSLFGKPNVDLMKVLELLTKEDQVRKSPPVAGFFANGEIAPVGLAGFSSGAKTTYMHGFTTVMALLCDFSTCEPVSDSTNSSDELGAWG